MLLERMVYQVPEPQRDAFGEAQQAWRRIRYANGLVVQVGGNDSNDPNSACILSLWRDDNSHRRFSSTIHGAVSEHNNQAAHYEAVAVEQFETVSRIPGQAGRMFVALSGGQLLCVAEHHIPTDLCSQFVRTQLDVWTPGLAAAQGMLGGLLAQSRDAADRFLVVTSWKNEEQYEFYQQHHLPLLRERAGSEGPVEPVGDRQIRLEQAWTVVGVGG